MGDKAVFILGTGHCGSTLLDLLLGSHRKVCSLGEVYRVVSSKPPHIICDVCGEICDFWKESLVNNLRECYNVSFLSRLSNNVDLSKKKEVRFFKTLFDASKADILIDSSKKPSWITKNGNVIRTNGIIKPLLIYLSRDGRAVINSFFRKYPERGLENIAQNWNQRIENINTCYDTWPDEDKIHIRYEELATTSTATIKEIAEFLGINFDPNMMEFWKYEHHAVNGNAGTKSMLLKFRDKHRYKKWIKDHNKNYYADQELGIHYDERWKSELKLEQIQKVNEIIEPINKSIKPIE